jgi:hypothetical protein
MRVCRCAGCCNGGLFEPGDVGVQYPEEVGGRSMVPKWGEGGTLIGGVKGSSSVIALLVGSKK